MAKKKKKTTNVQEPEPAYNKITIFHSLESMNEHDQQLYARMTPEERLQTMLEMRNTIWPDERTSFPFGHHIYFKK